MIWSGTIQGEPASKANSRRPVPRTAKSGKRYVAFIKSAKALSYVDAARLQVPVLPRLLRGPLKFTATIYYATRRPDLDESVILDVLQRRIYHNDSQVVQKEVRRRLDRDNPRAEIRVEELSP